MHECFRWVHVPGKLPLALQPSHRRDNSMKRISREPKLCAAEPLSPPLHSRHFLSHTRAWQWVTTSTLMHVVLFRAVQRFIFNHVNYAINYFDRTLISGFNAHFVHVDLMLPSLWNFAPYTSNPRRRCAWRQSHGFPRKIFRNGYRRCEKLISIPAASGNTAGMELSIAELPLKWILIRRTALTLFA